MTQNSFTTVLELVKALGTVIAATGLYLTYRQIRATVRWNRINATFTYLPDAIFAERERAVAREMTEFGIDLHQVDRELSPEAVTGIMRESRSFAVIKDFLNLFEGYATAYQAKAIDKDQAYVLVASQFIRYFTIFKPLIVELRKRRSSETYWSEFQRVVEEWQVRQKAELKAVNAARDEKRKGEGYP